MANLSSKPEALREAFVASLDWWREAGVLEHVDDAPGGWLRTAQEPAETPEARGEHAPPPPPPEPPRRGALSRFLDGDAEAAHPGDPAQWPTELGKFHQWWMESDALDPPGAYPRIAPSGPAQAQAMVIFGQPQGDDGGALLGGPAKMLATNMLRAMGLDPEAVYFASALPRHTLRPDWQELASAGYGALLVHHIGLARPRRIIACGERVWSLLAHETAQDPAALTTIATESGSIPAFAMPDLPTLLRHPAKRAQTWNRWLEWNHSSP